MLQVGFALLAGALLRGAVLAALAVFALSVCGVVSGRRYGLVLLLAWNLAGLLCLLYLAVPYLSHDTSIPNPDAMLAVERWDGAGMCLTLGALPLLAVNGLGYLWFRGRLGRLRGLVWFLPGLVCAGLTVHYWFISLSGG